METTGTLCPICRCPLETEDPSVACPDCHAAYHTDCWQDNGGCAIYGCAQVPPTEGRSTLEIPAAYWGQEHKPCPSCGAQILAAAVRCRQCGATFATARPENTASFQQRLQTEQQLPASRNAVVWQFVLCLLPCTAPVTALVAWQWRRSHRAQLDALPSLYIALSRIGLAVGLGQTAVFIVMAALFAAFRSR